MAQGAHECGSDTFAADRHRCAESEYDCKDGAALSPSARLHALERRTHVRAAPNKLGATHRLVQMPSGILVAAPRQLDLLDAFATVSAALAALPGAAVRG